MLNEKTWLEGVWIQTFTGRAFYPLAPRAADIAIEDIAHALAFQCRFGGHAERFYSVAEHCVHLSNFVEPAQALWALLHDASEAYLVDVPRPVKGALSGYREIEDRLMRVIALRFGLPQEMPAEVKEADYRILTDEARQAMKTPPKIWATEAAPLGVTLDFLGPQEAEKRFLKRFAELAGPEARHVE